MISHESANNTEVPRVGSISFLLLLLLFSVFFALYNSSSAYSSDEVWSVRVSTLPYSSEMAALKADVHPPLYFLILRAWIRLFGSRERVVRSLSGLFYLLTIYAVYQLGSRLYGTKAGLLCGAVYMSSPLAILSAQFARMYALLSLVSVLSTWLYLQFTRKTRPSRVAFACYILVNILGTFTHVAFFFVVLAQIFVHLLFYGRTRLKEFFIAVALSLLPYALFWAPILFRQIAKSEEGLAWLTKPGLIQIGELFFLYGGAFWLLIPLIAFVWWRSSFEVPTVNMRLRNAALPLSLLAITLVTPLMISQIKPIFNPRFAIIGLPFFALSIGGIISNRVTCVLHVALLVFTTIGIFVVHSASSTCDNRAVATYLDQTADDNDIVIFTSLTRMPIDYYRERLAGRKQLFEISFPSEIDNHPGYEGSIKDPARKPKLELEAQQLIDNIRRMALSNPGQRIFFFHGLHPEIDSTLERLLGKHFELLPDQGVRCEVSPYFREISVYR